MNYRDDVIRMEIARRQMRHEDLETASGVSRTTISAIANGSTDPRVSTLKRIADALGLKMSDLFKEDEQSIAA